MLNSAPDSTDPSHRFTRINQWKAGLADPLDPC